MSISLLNGKSAREVVGDNEYLDGEFMKTVQLRGKAVIAARGLSSACSAAKAACDHMHDWVMGTKECDVCVFGW